MFRVTAERTLNIKKSLFKFKLYPQRVNIDVCAYFKTKEINLKYFTSKFHITRYHNTHRGHEVAHLVEALRNQPQGSTADGAIVIFHSHNPSSRTMALGSTQPPKEMSTSDISWGVKAVGA
jgi:hypothetical protein